MVQNEQRTASLIPDGETRALQLGIGLLDGPRRREATGHHRQTQRSTQIPANSHAPAASMAAKV
jgi:hypothetical protein